MDLKKSLYKEICKKKKKRTIQGQDNLNNLNFEK